jgi:hypothetical protein
MSSAESLYDLLRQVRAELNSPHEEVFSNKELDVITAANKIVGRLPLPDLIQACRDVYRCESTFLQEKSSPAEKLLRQRICSSIKTIGHRKISPRSQFARDGSGTHG